MHSSDRPTVSPSPTCRLLFRRLLHPNVYVHTYTHPYRSYIHTPLRSSTPDRFLVLPSAVYAHTYLDRMLHILHALSRPTLGLSRNGFAGPSSFVFVLLISISYFLYYCFFPPVLFALISSAHCIRYHSLDSSFDPLSRLRLRLRLRSRSMVQVFSLPSSFRSRSLCSLPLFLSVFLYLYISGPFRLF